MNFFKPDPVIRNWKLYIISQGDKIYIGITSRKNPQTRINEHGTKKGAKWTYSHKQAPKKIIEIRQLGKISKYQAENIENNITHEYMNKYGKRKVRGGRMTATRRIVLRQHNPGSIQDITQILMISIVFAILILITIR